MQSCTIVNTSATVICVNKISVGNFIHIGYKKHRYKAQSDIKKHFFLVLIVEMKINAIFSVIRKDRIIKDEIARSMIIPYIRGLYCYKVKRTDRKLVSFLENEVLIHLVLFKNLTSRFVCVCSMYGLPAC